MRSGVASPIRRDGGAVQRIGDRPKKAVQNSTRRQRAELTMLLIFESCNECGFNGEEWSDAAAISAIAGLPTRFANAAAGLSSDDLLRRPVDGQWSIAEYADHVREVLFGMRFLLDIAVTQPGTDLGESPSSAFEPGPRQIDIDAALVGIEREATSLLRTFSELSPNEWHSTVTLDGANVDPHWIVRHAVHDSTHHLLDIERLRQAL